MSGPAQGLTLVDREGRRLGTLTPATALTWLAIVGPVLLVLTHASVSAPSAAGRPWWPAAVLLLLAVLTAHRPDSGLGLVMLTASGAWWAVSAGGDALAWSLPVAAALLVSHAAIAHAAAGPPGRATSVPALLATARTLLAPLAGTVAVWTVAVIAAGRVAVPVGALATALVAVAALPWLVARR